MRPLGLVLAPECLSLLTSSSNLGVVTHCCVDLVGMLPTQGGWRDAAYALLSVEHGKRERHACTYRSHGLNFVPLGFLPWDLLAWRQGVSSRLCVSVKLAHSYWRRMIGCSYMWCSRAIAPCLLLAVCWQLAQCDRYCWCYCYMFCTT